MYARERLDEAGEWPVLAERHARWALALAERERGLASARPRRGQPARRASLPASARIRRRSRAGDCAAAVLVAPDRSRGGEAALCGGRSKRLPSGTALRAEALLAARGDRAPQRHARPGLRARRGELRRRLRDRRQASRVAGAAVTRRVRDRERLGRRGGALARARARAGAKRALRRQPKRSASTRSASRSGSSAILRARRVSWRESIELFRALEGTPDTIPSPLNIAEIRMSQPGGRPGLRHIFEDTLQPLLEISCGAAVSYALANQAGIARVRGDLDRARALLDESAARFEAARRRRRARRRFSSVGRTSRWPRASWAPRAVSSSARSSCAPD